MVRLVCYLLCCMVLLAFIVPGCSREYSFEGNDTLNRPVPLPIDTAAVKDTTPTLQIDSCAGCANVFIEGQWFLKLNGTSFCGKIDTAIVSAERNGFTFFGPSTCSPDFGLIITVRLDENKLNQNLQNLQLIKSSIYYYDNIGGIYVVQSEQGKPFSVVISSYDNITKKAEGSFSGTGYTKEGKAIAITDGRWKTYLH